MAIFLKEFPKTCSRKLHVKISFVLQSCQRTMDMVKDKTRHKLEQ